LPAAEAQRHRVEKTEKSEEREEEREIGSGFVPAVFVLFLVLLLPSVFSSSVSLCLGG